MIISNIKSDMNLSRVLLQSTIKYDMNLKVEDFILTPEEHVHMTAKIAIKSVVSFHAKSIKQCCKSLLELEEKALLQIDRKAYRTSLILYWRFLKLYQNHIHEIRTSREVPIRMKSVLDERACFSILTIEWLKAKLSFIENNNYNGHLKVKERRRTEMMESQQDSPSKTTTYFKSKLSLPNREQMWREQHQKSVSIRQIYKTDTLDDIDDFIKVQCLSENFLKKLHLPVKTLQIFQKLAIKNDFRNIKTSGILAAREAKDMIISHLIIAKQVCPSCKFIKLNDPEIAKFITANNLQHIGFIFSTPGREPDLNCYEVHDLCNLTTNVPYAFAIVTSNIHSQVKFISLTNQGYENLMNCKDTSKIHAHNFPKPMYMEALHLVLTNDYEITVKDFRNENDQIDEESMQCTSF